MVVGASGPGREPQHWDKIRGAKIEGGHNQPAHLAVERSRLLARQPVDDIGFPFEQCSDPTETTQRLFKTASR